jgi:hypothetical protein
LSGVLKDGVQKKEGNQQMNDDAPIRNLKLIEKTIALHAEGQRFESSPAPFKTEINTNPLQKFHFLT